MPSDGTLSFGPSSDTDAPTYGQIAHAKDNITTKADAQSNQIIIKKLVPSGTHTLYSNNAGTAEIIIPAKGMISFSIQLAALENGAGNGTYLHAYGAAKDNGGGGAIIGTVTYITIAEDTAGLHSMAVTCPGGGILRIQGRNNSQVSTNFVCFVRYTQTLFP
jgi:hypothetical protein